MKLIDMTPQQQAQTADRSTPEGEALLMALTLHEQTKNDLKDVVAEVNRLRYLNGVLQRKLADATGPEEPEPDYPDNSEG